MTTYIKLSTLEYPRYEGNIRQEYPEITEDQTGPTFPCPADYAPVQHTPEPEATDTQVVEEQMPQCIDGVWQQVWLVRDATPEELARRDANIQAMNNPPQIPQP